MKTLAEKDIEESVDLLKNPSAWLRRQIEEETKEQVTHTVTPETHVAVLAVVTNPNTDTKRVLKVANYTAADLYGLSQAPVIDFNNSVCGVLTELEKLRRIPEADLEFEVQAAYMWRSVQNLQRYLGTSPAHDEALSYLQQLCFSERAQPFDVRKLEVLYRALAVLRDNVFLSDRVLEAFADVLEEGGFELNAPMEFVQSPE
jgi:hypothetical protein